MDADYAYPAELVPKLVKKLVDEDLQFITCDRLSLAEDGSMSGLHGFGNWALSFTARLLFGYGIKDSQSGMWVFRKSVFDNKMRPTMTACHCLRKSKSSPVNILVKARQSKYRLYRPRVGDAEIHTWGDGWKNFKFLFAKRVGLNRTKTPWGSRESNPDSTNKNLPEQ